MSRKLAPRKSKSPDSQTVPDQYLFINKSAKSESLSSSTAGERFYIHSHVHSKHHSKKRQQQALSSASDTDSPAMSPSPSKIFTWQSNSPDGPSVAAVFKEEGNGFPFNNSPYNVASPRSSSELRRSTQSPVSPSPSLQYQQGDSMRNAQFHRAASPIDETDQKLLSCAFTAFIEQTLKVGSWPIIKASMLSNRAQLREVLNERLQHCLIDTLTMYTTLAYCASCWQWTDGDTADLRPTEHYMVKAIESLRPRLKQGDQVDTYLVQNIYALAMAEMWRANYQPATTHLSIIRHLLLKAGGIRSLKPHLMESLILCDKYTALGKFSAPIFYQDWKPDQLPLEELEEIKTRVHPYFPNMAKGFFQGDDEDESVFGPELLAIIRDMVPCIFGAVYSRLQSDSDPILRHYLFMQHQHIIGRLLAPSRSKNQVQECVRVALIIWLLKITKYFGAQRWSQWLLPRLQRELMVLKTTGPSEDYDLPVPLVFWMCHLGALTANDPGIKNWFLGQTLQTVQALRIPVGRDSFRRVLERYFFIRSEGVHRFEVVLKALGMPDEDD